MNSKLMMDTLNHIENNCIDLYKICNVISTKIMDNGNMGFIIKIIDISGHSFLIIEHGNKCYILSQCDKIMINYYDTVVVHDLLINYIYGNSYVEEFKNAWITLFKYPAPDYIVDDENLKCKETVIITNDLETLHNTILKI